MNYEEAIEKVQAKAAPGVGSSLACRPLMWRVQSSRLIIPHQGYLALLSLDGPNKWFIMGLGDPVEAKFDPDTWLILTRNDQEWEVIPFPLGKEKI